MINDDLQGIVRRARLTEALHGTEAAVDQGVRELADAHADGVFLALGPSVAALPRADRSRAARAMAIGEATRFRGFVRDEFGSGAWPELSSAIKNAERLGAKVVKARLKTLFAEARLWGGYS